LINIVHVYLYVLNNIFKKGFSLRTNHVMYRERNTPAGWVA